MDNANLRIDCSKLKPATSDQLFDTLTRFFNDIRLVGNDTIYARGSISSYDYSNVCRILNRYGFKESFDEDY